MRRTGAWATVVLCVAAAGCLDRAARPGRAPADGVRARSFSPTGFGGLPAPETNGLYVESVLLERPVGDQLLDRDLWAADRSPLPAETEALLAENGLRVIILGGNLPPAFQKLVASEADTVNPHGLTFANRADAVLPTAGPTDPCAFEVRPDLAGGRVKASFRQARCGVQVRPERAADGRVKVWCEPQVQHGDRQDWLRPTADGTQFVKQGAVPLERYPGLGFAAVLGADEYLVVGSPAGADGTLGAALFGVEANGRPRQRVLVVRAGWRDDRAPASPHGRPSLAAEASRW